MIGKEYKSIVDLLNDFPDKESCIKYLEELRWGNIAISPYDPQSKVYKCGNGKYYCKNTNKYFNVCTNTLFEGTKISLQKWFLAIWFILSHKKGVSTRQLARDIHVTQKTAWFMMHRIRNCFGLNESESQLTGVVEIDETFVGGKNKNRHKDKKVPQCQGRAFTDKTPVLGMLERGGRLIAQVIPNTSQASITPVILNRISKEATLYTDEWKGYDKVDKLYNRKYVDHGRGEYVSDDVTTNSIEGFWSILKRGIIGVYHVTSKKHLQKYVDEFVWRYNIRNLNQNLQFNSFLCNINHRLRYKDLIYDY